MAGCGTTNSGLIDDGIVIKDNIDIDGTRTILFQSFPSHFQFDGQDGLRQGQRLERCFHQQCLVQECSLIGFAPGSCFIKGGYFRNLPDPCLDKGCSLLQFLFLLPILPPISKYTLFIYCTCSKFKYQRILFKTSL